MRYRIPSFLTLALIASNSAHAAQDPCNTWDPRFGASGPDAAFEDFASFDDGTGLALYAAGRFRAIGTQPIEGVARWNGASWTQVGGGLRNATSLAVFDDGSGPSLYAAGSFTIALGAPANTIARWNGASWVALPVVGPQGVSEIVNDLEVFDDGTGPALYLAGRIVLAGITGSKRVVRWNGSAWADVNAGITATNSGHALGVFDAGSGPRLYLGIQGIGQPASAMRWESGAWVNVSTGIANADVRAFATFSGPSGTALYAAGRFPALGGAPIDGIRKFDGTTWSAVGGGLGGPTVQTGALAIHDDGTGPRLFTVGSFASAGGIPANGIASWDGTTWVPAPPGLSAPGIVTGTALLSHDDGQGPGLFVGGTFSRAGRTAATNAAVLRNGTWRELASGAGTTGYLTALSALDIGSGPALYASGTFDTIGSTVTGRVARWDGSTWEPLGEPLDTNAEVNAFTVFDDGSGPQVYATGPFTRIGGIAAQGLARWNGVQWSTIGGLGGVGGPSGTDGRGEALLVHDDGSGPALYVAGQFTTAGGILAGNIARWDGTTWSALGSGTNQIVRDLAEYDDGSGLALYACGSFVTAGGVTVPRIARWHGQAWSTVGASSLVDTGLLTDLAVYDDGSGPTLFLVGYSFLTGPITEATVARWDGTEWTAAMTLPYVAAGRLGLFHDGNGPRLVGGFVDGSVSASTVLMRAFDGAQWTTLPGTIDGTSVAQVTSFDAEHDGVPDLYIAGSFRTAGGRPASNLGVFASCGTIGQVRCAGDGSATACPCANFGSTGHGCANSVHASGARLVNGGIASLANDTLSFAASEVTGTFALFVQGGAVGTAGGVVFGDGLSCVAGSVLRLGTAGIASGSATLPMSGSASISSLGFITAATSRVYQVVYRNQASFCTPSATNTTNGLLVTWTL